MISREQEGVDGIRDTDTARVPQMTLRKPSRAVYLRDINQPIRPPTTTPTVNVAAIVSTG
jgi:hypothetical protein